MSSRSSKCVSIATATPCCCWSIKMVRPATRIARIVSSRRFAATILRLFPIRSPMTQPQTETNFDAVIAGGGPVGMMAAIALARHDLTIGVVDHTDPKDRHRKPFRWPDHRAVPCQYPAATRNRLVGDDRAIRVADLRSPRHRRRFAAVRALRSPRNRRRAAGLYC